MMFQADGTGLHIRAKPRVVAIVYRTSYKYHTKAATMRYMNWLGPKWLRQKRGTDNLMEKTPIV
jgi:hypothetical protein